MYLGHFGLTEFPFGLTPDTQYYFGLPSHKEALDVLLYSLKNGEGFIKITGNVGTGKTMLCRKLLNQLQAPFVTAYIPNPHLTATGLYIAIAEELGIATNKNDEQSYILQKINKYLLITASRRQKPVLIIDEAQAMPLETLEALRLITNLETEKQKLFQIILIGQPELDELLQQKSIRQLRQRISFSHALKQLTAQDVETYITHRLSIANCPNPAIFSTFANRAIHFYSKGIPRIINILAHKALLSAYGKGLPKVGLKQIQLAARDTEDTKKRRHPFEYRKSILFALILSLSLFIIPFLHPNHSNQNIFEMSILNQVLQDLEKRTPDNRPEQHQSANSKHANISENKLLYIPFVLICITGIFIFIKYRPNEVKKVVVEPNSLQQSSVSPNDKTASIQADFNRLDKNPSEDQKNDAPHVTLLKLSQTDKTKIQGILREEHKEKENQMAEQLFETAKKQQNQADKQLTLKLALEQNPQHIEIRLLLANTLFQLGLIDEATQTLDQGIEIHPKNQQFTRLRKQLSRQNKQRQKALNTVQKIDANYKKDTINSIPAKQKEQKQVTKPTKEKKQKVKSKSLNNKQQAKQLLKKAHQEQNLTDKQNILERVVQLNPQHIKARLLLAHTLFNQGLTEQAEEFLNNCLTSFPQNLKFINLRSQLFLHKNQPQAALNILLKLDGENIQDENYLSFLAAAYQQNHDSSNAQLTYRRLVSINPEKAEYWLGFAIASEKQGDKKEALAAYQQALDKNPLKDVIVSYIKQRISLLKK